MYHDWLANVVMIKKYNMRWKVSVYFINLNKICSQENFYLSNIDKLINFIMVFSFWILLKFILSLYYTYSYTISITFLPWQKKT